MLQNTINRKFSANIVCLFFVVCYANNVRTTLSKQIYNVFITLVISDYVIYISYSTLTFALWVRKDEAPILS